MSAGLDRESKRPVYNMVVNNNKINGRYRQLAGIYRPVVPGTDIHVDRP
jgi:ribosomal protein S16